MKRFQLATILLPACFIASTATLAAPPEALRPDSAVDVTESGAAGEIEEPFVEEWTQEDELRLQRIAPEILREELNIRYSAARRGVAPNSRRVRDCGTPPIGIPGHRMLELIQPALDYEARMAKDGPSVQAAKLKSITTYVWVIYDGNPHQGTQPTKKDVISLIDRINVQLAGNNGRSLESGFRLKRRATYSKKDEKLAANHSPAETQEFYRLYRRGSSKTDLNIYLWPDLSDWGVATLPDCLGPGPDYCDQWVLLDWEVVCGEDKYQYYSPVHEVGHWLGLLHTFEFGCSSEGDLVSDTPMHLGPNEVGGTRACGIHDTCPLDPGNDPVDNFMSYSGFTRDIPHDCRERFTEGQVTRMKSMTATFRGFK